MQQKSIGIYIGSISDLKNLSKLIEFLKNKYITNINIFTDIDIGVYLDIANIASFYMTFCPYALVFTNIADFLQYQYDIISKEIYVLTSLDEIQKYNLEKNNLSNITILTIKDEEIHAI